MQKNCASDGKPVAQDADADKRERRLQNFKSGGGVFI